MLAPGESLTDRLAALRRGERPQATAAAGATGGSTRPAPTRWPARCTRRPARCRRPGRPAAGRTYGGNADATQRVDAGGHPDATQRVSYGSPADATQQVGYGGAPEATQRVGGTYGGGNQWSVPGTGQPWATAPAASGGGALGQGPGHRWSARHHGQGLAAQGAARRGRRVGRRAAAHARWRSPAATTPRRAPRPRSPPRPPRRPPPSRCRSTPPAASRSWCRRAGRRPPAARTPTTSTRRTAAARSASSPRSGAAAPSGGPRSAENGLKTRSTSCVKPYNQISSTETELAEQAGSRVRVHLRRG